MPFAVCYTDLDNFKAYNDTYGFLKGDAVIHQTAHVLLACQRAAQHWTEALEDRCADIAHRDRAKGRQQPNTASPRPRSTSKTPNKTIFQTVS